MWENGTSRWVTRGPSPGPPPLCARRAGLTLVHAGVAVLEHGELVDLAELLEERLEVLLLQVARDLPHEELDGIQVLHAVGLRRGLRAAAAAHGGGSARRRRRRGRLRRWRERRRLPPRLALGESGHAPRPARLRAGGRGRQRGGNGPAASAAAAAPQRAAPQRPLPGPAPPRPLRSWGQRGRHRRPSGELGSGPGGSLGTGRMGQEGGESGIARPRGRGKSCVFRAQEGGGPWEQGRALSTHEGTERLLIRVRN